MCSTSIIYHKHFFSFFFFSPPHTLKNDTEKSASDPGTPPQTSKLGDLKSTSKSPKTSPKTSPKSPEVKSFFKLICTTAAAVSRLLRTLSFPAGGSCHNSPDPGRVSRERTVTRPFGKRWDSVRRGGRREGVGLGFLAPRATLDETTATCRLFREAGSWC